MTLAPYYDHGGITIYHGDCRDILPLLGVFDLLLTDPPYGIGEAAGRNKSRGKLATSRDYGDDDWDDAPPDRATIELCRAHAKRSIIWGGNYFALPEGSCWLVWDKDNGETDFADCELAWTNLPGAVRRKRYRWHGMLQEPGRRKEQRYHPTQKPLEVIAWALGRALPVGSVLDPFMGSGTTLRAAKDAGIRGVGIERIERYCEVAVKRLAQETLFGGL